MVPKTIMVPETFMTQQTVTVQKPVGVVQNRQRTVQKVIEGQKIIESQQIIQYERPRVQVIPGRMLGTQQLGVQQVGVQWNRAYYDQSTPPVSPNLAVNQAAMNPNQYQTIYAPIGAPQQQQAVSPQFVGGGQFLAGGGQPFVGGGQQLMGEGGQPFVGGGQPPYPGPYPGPPPGQFGGGQQYTTAQLPNSPSLGPYGQPQAY